MIFLSCRAEQRRAEQMQSKQKDKQEGDEYRRLAEQYAVEQMEIEKYRRLTQKDTKEMYDQALEDKQQMKRMEQMLDEVCNFSLFSTFVDFSLKKTISFRKKMKNYEFMPMRRNESLECDERKRSKLISSETNRREMLHHPSFLLPGRNKRLEII